MPGVFWLPILNWCTCIFSCRFILSLKPFSDATTPTQEKIFAVLWCVFFPLSKEHYICFCISWCYQESLISCFLKMKIIMKGESVPESERMCVKGLIPLVVNYYEMSSTAILLMTQILWSCDLNYIRVYLCLTIGMQGDSLPSEPQRKPINWKRTNSLEKPEAGKDWGQEEKGATEDEMVGWHHRLSGHEFEQTLGDSEGQGSLVCCSPWGRKETNIHSLVSEQQQISVLSHLHLLLMLVQGDSWCSSAC